MNISRVDLNLLVYFDVLLRELNVTRAAEELGISQPAMSNVLRRLRTLFKDPLLVRTSGGMTPTQRAMDLQPLIRNVVEAAEHAVLPQASFHPADSKRIFRVMASDYTETTLLAPLLDWLGKLAPGICLDIMTPSDVGFHDVESGKVDFMINRFDELPQSFHQLQLWDDGFCCVMSVDNPIRERWSLESYLAARHVWVSKTGMGVSVGMTPQDVQRLGWVDEALRKAGYTREISVFTRHYQAALQLAQHEDLIATVPSLAGRTVDGNRLLTILPPPFEIPRIELKMVWSPLVQHDPGHKWMRHLIKSVSQEIAAA